MHRVGRAWAKYSLDNALPDTFFPGDMTSSTPDRARLLRRLAWTGSALGLGLIVLGGVVRITGSGMGCGDHWPRCDGEWFPPLDLPTLIEIGHRWAAALVSLLVFAVALVGWRRHRTEPALRNPALLAAVLLVAVLRAAGDISLLSLGGRCVYFIWRMPTQAVTHASTSSASSR